MTPRLLMVVAMVALSVVADAEDRPQVVRQVEVDADGALGRDVVVKLLGLEKGSPLDRRRLREGVHALYAGGEVEHLVVEAEEVEGGIDVTVVVRQPARISAVVVVGVRGHWEGRVRSWLELEAGQAVSASQVEAAVRRVLRETNR